MKGCRFQGRVGYFEKERIMWHYNNVGCNAPCYPNYGCGNNYYGYNNHLYGCGSMYCGPSYYCDPFQSYYRAERGGLVGSLVGGFLGLAVGAAAGPFTAMAGAWLGASLGGSIGWYAGAMRGNRGCYYC
ncbi:MAG: hypothetical protein AB7S38_35080 [Vulcanimicrobiota bacterium]